MADNGWTLEVDGRVISLNFAEGVHLTNLIEMRDAFTEFNPGDGSAEVRLNHDPRNFTLTKN